MNYFDLATRRLCTADGTAPLAPLRIDCEHRTLLEFQMLDAAGRPVPPEAGKLYTFSGALGYYGNQTLFAATCTPEPGAETLVFNVDTYTAEYVRYVQSENMKIRVQIHRDGDGGDVLLFDTALAVPRLYDPKNPPEPVTPALFFEFSADGSDWHGELQPGDTLERVRWGADGIPSEPFAIPYGPQGQEGKQGEPGADGKQGPQGATGEPGGVYAYAVPLVELDDVPCHYLDGTYTEMRLADFVRNVSALKFYIRSASDSVTGNVVLTPSVGGVPRDAVVIPVTATDAPQVITFDPPATGMITITRDTEDEDDTLKDVDPVTAVIGTDLEVEVSK